jgi:hypothetical protein
MVQINVHCDFHDNMFFIFLIEIFVKFNKNLAKKSNLNLEKTPNFDPKKKISWV